MKNKPELPEFPEVTEEQKEKVKSRLRELFKVINQDMADLQEDFDSSDLNEEASAVFVGGELLDMYCQFKRHLRELSQNVISQEMQEALESMPAKITKEMIN